MSADFNTSGGTLEDTQGNDLLIMNDGITDGFLRDAIEDEEIGIVQSLEAFEELEENANQLIRVQDNLADYQEAIQAAEGTQHEEVVNATLATAIENAIGSLNVPYDAVGPALEDGTPVVSMEGIGETIKNIWRAIVNTIRAIWRAIGDFFTAIIGRVVRLRRTAESLLEKANENRGVKATSDVIAMGSELYYLTRNYIVPHGAADVLALLSNHLFTTEYLLGGFTQATLKSAKEIGEAAKKFDVANAEASLSEMNDAHSKAYREAIDKGLGTLKTHLITNDPRYSKGTYRRAETLGGNYGVVARIAVADLPPDASALEKATAIQEMAFTIDPINNKAARTSTKGNIPTFKMAEIVSICAKAKEICESMEKYNSETVKRIRNMADTLEADFDVMRKNVEAASNLDAHTTSCYKAALRYLKAYPMWCSKGQRQLISLNCNVVYAALIAANRSLKQYK